MNAPFNRTVIWLTRRQLFAKRRVWTALALMLVPTLIATIIRLNADPTELDSVEVLSGMYRDLVIAVLLPIAALLFGTSAFGGEVEDGTLVYLMVKPIPRWQMTLSKYLVAAVSTIVVIAPGVLFAWMMMPGEVPFDIPLGFMLGTVVGALLYCALFMTLGITSRRSLALGLVYVVAFENVLSRNIVGAKSLSVREFALSTAHRVVGDAGTPPDFLVPMDTVYVMGAVFFIAALGLAVMKLQKYEVAERL